jgi:hypothetical protein
LSLLLRILRNGVELEVRLGGTPQHGASIGGSTGAVNVRGDD